MEIIGTFWAFIPPVVAIVVGLITKKVNLALILGIMTGAILYASFNPIKSIDAGFEVMTKAVGKNVEVLIFLVLLGMFGYLLNLSGASKKYGLWARKKFKTKRSSLFATFFLGIIIFVDDYFNCLTIGTVMKPVTDRNKISREKLAYVIDTTAAPICMIAPISSWAAAVSSSLPSESGINGFNLFLRTIVCNYYSLLSLIMVFLIILLNFDFGKMRKYEGDIKELEKEEENINPKVKIFDLILPILFLIMACIISMLYTGGLFSGKNIIDSFADCDSIHGLCIGAFISILFLLVLYVPRKVITFNQFLSGLEEGFKNMLPSILILSFAWTLGMMCGSDYLNVGKFVSDTISGNISLNIMPIIFFVSALLLSFSTGTSWGTFAILIPIEVGMFGTDTNLMVITTAALLGGSVCGDHISPISDTTILSSAGAGCDHINHVQTQAIYGIFVAIISIIGYLLAGLTDNQYLGLFVSAAILIMALISIKMYFTKKDNHEILSDEIVEENNA